MLENIIKHAIRFDNHNRAPVKWLFFRKDNNTAIYTTYRSNIINMLLS